jgi:PTS system nitrogen regulatory IIA component
MTAAMMTFNEVRNYLRVSDNTLRGLLNSGELPAGKIGSHWRIRADDLEAYLERVLQHKREGAQRGKRRDPGPSD